jgi:hypothetical protein
MQSVDYYKPNHILVVALQSVKQELDKSNSLIESQNYQIKKQQYQIDNLIGFIESKFPDFEQY